MNKNGILTAVFFVCVIASCTIASAQTNSSTQSIVPRSSIVGPTDPAYQDILLLHDFGATEYYMGTFSGRGIVTRETYAYLLRDLSPFILHPQTFQQRFGVFVFGLYGEKAIVPPAIYFRPDLVQSSGALAIMASLYRDFTPELEQIGVNVKPILAQIALLRRVPPSIVKLPLVYPASDSEYVDGLRTARAMGAFTSVPANDQAYSFLVRLHKLGALDAPGIDSGGSRRAMTRYQFALAIAHAKPLIEEARPGVDPSFESTWGYASWQPALLHNAESLYLYSQLVQEFQPEVQRLGVNLAPLTAHLASLAKAAPQNTPTQPFVAMDKTHWADFSMWECRTAGILIGEG